AEPEEHATMFGLQDRLLAAWSSERDPGSRGGPDSQRQESPGGRAGRESRGEGAGTAWLLAAALALAPLASRCASAEAALARISRAGAKELGRGAGEGSTPLHVVLADLQRYLSVLVLVRIAAELSATMLVVAVLLHWLGHGWRAFVITAAVMTVVIYV